MVILLLRGLPLPPDHHISSNRGRQFKAWPPLLRGRCAHGRPALTKHGRSQQAVEAELRTPRCGVIPGSFVRES
ncbi:hypothetical protein MHYP_G00301220 [Metynnis hypsauchen]